MFKGSGRGKKGANVLPDREQRLHRSQRAAAIFSQRPSPGSAPAGLGAGGAACCPASSDSPGLSYTQSHRAGPEAAGRPATANESQGHRAMRGAAATPACFFALRPRRTTSFAAVETAYADKGPVRRHRNGKATPRSGSSLWSR